MSEAIKIPFGMAQITVNGEDVGLQGDAAVFSATPTYIDVEVYEMGVYDKALEKWEVMLTVRFAQEDYSKFKMAMPHLEELTDVEGNVTGLTDGKLMQRARDKAVEVVVHPIEAGDSKEFDVTVFKAFPVGTFERTYGKEASVYEVEFMALPRTGNINQHGNYFRIGEEVAPVI
ncbi:hypothetical protein [Jeotgalibacillus malaysiensis]|uniref:hypothetical protein n=1 Tax=Jeotgalibacillus malaysiensis TaxID=1508404 RepID=UPI003850D173